MIFIVLVSVARFVEPCSASQTISVAALEAWMTAFADVVHRVVVVV